MDVGLGTGGHSKCKRNTFSQLSVLRSPFSILIRNLVWVFVDVVAAAAVFVVDDAFFQCMQFLAERDSLQFLLGILRQYEDQPLICFTGLVILTELAGDLDDGPLADLGKNGGVSFAVKQLYLHQDRDIDLCQQAMWLVNALVRIDANVKVLHGVGGQRGITAAQKLYVEGERERDSGRCCRANAMELLVQD